MEILGLILVVFLFFWLVGGKKKPYKNRRKQYKQRKPYSSNRKKLKPKINPTSFEPFSGYAHVIDGDTIKIRGMKIRLAGINAPELDRPYGVKSKYEMVNIVKGKKVYVVPDGTTSFDRIVATCYIDGDVDIGAELIKRGLALDIPSFTGGKFSSLTECHSGLMNRMTDKHTMRKNENGELVIYSNDGNYIWAESCVPTFN